MTNLSDHRSAIWLTLFRWTGFQLEFMNTEWIWLGLFTFRGRSYSRPPLRIFVQSFATRWRKSWRHEWPFSAAAGNKEPFARSASICPNFWRARFYRAGLLKYVSTRFERQSRILYQRINNQRESCFCGVLEKHNYRQYCSIDLWALYDLGVSRAITLPMRWILNVVGLLRKETQNELFLRLKKATLIGKWLNYQNHFWGDV